MDLNQKKKKNQQTIDNNKKDSEEKTKKKERQLRPLATLGDYLKEHPDFQKTFGRLLNKKRSYHKTNRKPKD